MTNCEGDPKQDGGLESKTHEVVRKESFYKLYSCQYATRPSHEAPRLASFVWGPCHGALGYRVLSLPVVPPHAIDVTVFVEGHVVEISHFITVNC